MRAAINLLLLSFVSIYATCNKRIDCKQTTYSFEAFYKAYPDRDSIRVNDTIWFELNTSTQLKDLITNSMVDYNNAVNFGPSIQYLAFTGGDVFNPGVVPAANSFDNVLISGTEVLSNMPDKVRGFRCIEVNGRYNFKVGVVPKKQGTFAIALSDVAGVYRNTNKCDKAVFKLIFKDTDQHLYLNELNRPGYTPSEYERTHMCCFKVY